MKIDILRISNDILLGKKQDIETQYLIKSLLEAGETVSNILISNNNPVNIENHLTNTTTDLTIIIGESTSSKNFSIKKVLSNILNKEIIKSNTAINFVNNFYQKNNVPILTDSENEYYIVQSSQLLQIESSPMQAFMLENNNHKFIFIPGEINICQEFCKKYLLNLSKNNNSYKTTIIKTFGINENDIYNILKDIINNKYKILITTYPNNLENSIIIRYNQNLDEQIISEFLRKITERLNKYIFAFEEVNLATMAYELLEISKQTLSIAETITSGNIATEFLKNCNLSNNLINGSVVCLSNQSIIKQLNVNNKITNEYGKISAEVAYEMAISLLEQTHSDLVLVTNGDINISDNEKNGNTCFIAVGNMDGIHVYKNTIYGTKEQVINSLTQTAIYYLIKNIKQNDLFFDKTTI